MCVRVCWVLYTCLSICVDTVSDCLFLKCVIVRYNYTCPNWVCALSCTCTSIYACAFMIVCAHAFQAHSVWTPACFQYSLLLGGDYPAWIWLLSAVDWKLERPGAPWEERSENFLNPVFTLHPSTPAYPATSPGTTLYWHWCFFCEQKKTQLDGKICRLWSDYVCLHRCVIWFSKGVVVSFQSKFSLFQQFHLL